MESDKFHRFTEKALFSPTPTPPCPPTLSKRALRASHTFLLLPPAIFLRVGACRRLLKILKKTGNFS